MCQSCGETKWFPLFVHCSQSVFEDAELEEEEKDENEDCRCCLCFFNCHSCQFACLELQLKSPHSPTAISFSISLAPLLYYFISLSASFSILSQLVTIINISGHLHILMRYNEFVCLVAFSFSF